MNEYEFRAVRDVINTLHHDPDRLKLLRLLNEIMGRYDQ